MGKNRERAILKRRNGICKKASELATLCEAELCLIAVGPGGGCATWPEDGQEVARVLDRYRALPKAKKKMNEANKYIKDIHDDEMDQEARRKRKQDEEAIDWDNKNTLWALSDALKERIETLRARIERGKGPRVSEEESPCPVVYQFYPSLDHNSVACDLAMWMTPPEPTSVGTPQHLRHNWGEGTSGLSSKSMNEFAGATFGLG